MNRLPNKAAANASDAAPTPAANVSTQVPAPKTVGDENLKVGTLQYTKGGIVILFFWLFWNDACFMLMENVAPGLTPLLLKSYGASNKEIALFLSTLVGMATIWINPVISTYSDRFRHPLGRRRPFLLVATPFCALFLMGIPFMPDCFRFLSKVPGIAHMFGGGGVHGVVLLIGICYMAYAVFNSVLCALFSYYFWDVVPVSMLGRFNALAKIVTTLTSFIWNYFFFGLAERHMKAVFMACALIFLVVYWVSLWKVKEGEYPPPDRYEKGNPFAPLLTYFKECYGHSYYLWFFGANTIFQISNLSNMYQIFYLHNDLGLSLDIVGKMRSWPSLAIFLLAYPMGKLIDYLNPIRLMTPVMFTWGACNILCFLFLHDKWSLLIGSLLITVISFPGGICMSTMTVEVFPREKLGQFCSANYLMNSFFCFFIAIGLGALFDCIKNYRYVYLWSAAFQIIAAGCYFKVYSNWRRRQSHPPLVHAE